MDGVIMPSVEYICKLNNIDFNNVVNYRFDKCEKLTKEQVNIILDSFGRKEILEGTGYYPGALEIKDLTSRYEISFHSLYVRFFECQYKRNLIKKLVPTIKDENIQLAQFGDVGNKEFKYYDIIVEDSAENILNNYDKANLFIILDKPYNRNIDEKYLKKILRLQTLDECIQYLKNN